MVKIKNKNGEVIELAEGRELQQEIAKFTRSNETFKTHAGDMIKNNHSAPVRQFLASKGVTVADYVRSLKIDVRRSNVRALLDNDGLEPVFQAMMDEAMRVGFYKQGRWQRLVASDIDVDSLSIDFPTLDEDDVDADLREIGQGAPIPVGTIKVSEKQAKVKKRGRGLEWTDEVKAMKINLVALFMQRMGLRLGREYENIAINALLNGYFADGFDAAPTVGVKTANTLGISDLFYATKYMEEEFGYTPTVAMMNLNTAERWATLQDGDNAYLYLNEMKNGDYPNVLRADPFVNNTIPDDRIVLVDESAALVRYVYKEFGVESDRSVKTQVEGSYGTEQSEILPFQKNARLIVTLDDARS